MHLRTLTVLGVSAALAAGALAAAPATASPSRASAPAAAATAPSGGRDLGREARPVTRFIVTMKDRGPVSRDVTDAVAAAAGVPEAKPGRRLTGGARLVALSQPVPLADAVKAAERITARGDVASAQPDTWIQIADANPAGWDDTSLKQWDVWDESVTGGGYASKAPVAWARTKGDPSVVVAVVDTGITKHPDLDANVVPGYDFIGYDDAPPFGGLNLQAYTANDGDGRDADPSDPGDWVTSAEQTSANWFKGCQAENSSWHGTHVAGTIAAVQGNGIGVQGVAPGVRIQPVRAVGKCGGYLSDIADGIRWASGARATGDTSPINATPAKVINVSLGGPGACDAGAVDGYMQKAINDARAAGATVVVAAGNSDTSVAADPMNPATTGSTPADCDGVVTVGAIAKNGTRATYSNFGPEVALSAQGGESPAVRSGDGVLSTINAGTTRPTSPTYGGADYVGTSMATPHVAGAAALLQSTRAASQHWLLPDQVLDELKKLVQPPAVPCGLKPCGVGVLDLSVPLPDAPPGPPTDVVAQGRDTATGVLVSWAAPADDGGSAVTSYTVERSADGGDWQPVATGTAATSLTDGTATTAGANYRYRVLATNAIGPSKAWAVSDPTQVYDVAPPLVPAGVTVAAPDVDTVVVDWSAPASDGLAPTGYEIRYRRGSDAWLMVPVPSGTLATLHPGLGGTLEVQVRATAATDGQWSVPRSVAVTALAQSLTTSTATVRPYPDGFQDLAQSRLVVSSNVAATGTLTILKSGVELKVVDISLDGVAPFQYLWDQTAVGSYIARLALTNPAHPDTADAQPVKDIAVTVASSQVGTPSVTRSTSTVYPYKDSYRDTVALAATTNVPATQSWRIRNSKGTTVRTWSWSTRALSRSVTWNGRKSDGTSLPAGTYSLTVTAKGGEGTATTRTVSIGISTKRLRSASFSTTLYPASASITALQGSKVLSNYTYDGVTKAELHVRGGADGQYDVLALAASLPSSTILPTGVRVKTCLRRSPPGSGNLLVAGYMSSTTRYAGWFAAVVDETSGDVTVSKGTLDCRTPNLVTPAAAVAGNRVRWSLFNLGPSSSGYVPVYSFTITGTRYYLA